VKRRLILAVLLVSGSIALFFLQRSRATAEVTPRPLLYLLADSERDVERIPLALTRVSDAEEIQVGEQLAHREGLVPRPLNAADLEITEYLNTVGGAVARHVRRRAIPYQFYLSDDPTWINACALPGGYIIVGRGLLKLMESEDELAAVLGHEITHVDDRHAIERLQYQLASRNLGLEGIYQLGRPAVEIFKAGYTREQEFEADRGGLELAVEAGYSPVGIVNLMERFEKLEEQAQQQAPSSPIGEIVELPFGALQEYFRSHPPASERKAALETEIRSKNWNESAPVRPLAIRKDF
jgi:beta-barrel assembly-enhancing protease